MDRLMEQRALVDRAEYAARKARAYAIAATVFSVLAIAITFIH